MNIYLAVFPSNSRMAVKPKKTLKDSLLYCCSTVLPHTANKDLLDRNDISPLTELAKLIFSSMEHLLILDSFLSAWIIIPRGKNMIQFYCC